MKTDWNPNVDYIEGTLVQKGLMTEVFDLEKNDLIRQLTDEGRFVVKNLLKNPEWKGIYLKLALIQFSRFPVETRKILWKKLLDQLNIK